MKSKDATLRVCENIFELCKKKGVRPQSVEKQVGLSRGYLRRCLNNVSNRMSIDAVEQIAGYFNVKVEDLLKERSTKK